MKKNLRNGRKWYEDGAVAVLAKHPNGQPVLVTIVGLLGDTPRQQNCSGRWLDGETIYQVEEVASRQRYPASDRDLRPCKDAGERDALLAARKS